MHIVQRLVRSLRTVGVSGTFAKLVCPCFDRKFDCDYGTDTCGTRSLHTFQIESANRDCGARYEASRVLPLRKMLSIVRQMTPPESVLVDFGSGKGRVLLLAAEHGFRSRGVEFAEELCEIARRNVAAFNAKTGNKNEITIVNGDAAGYAIRADETVFFLFTPFYPIVFEKVLANLAASLKAHQRKILIVICLPSAAYHQAVQARPEFQLVSKYCFWGYNFALYSSKN